MEMQRLAKAGVPAGANLDSMREAELDSALVRFRKRRRVAPDSAMQLDRKPRLLNASLMQQWINSYYPPLLLSEGVGGTTMVVFYARPDSTPAKTRVLRSSGSSELDLASVHVVQELLKVAPGMYHRCAVWTMISMPVNWVPHPPRRPWGP
jgi:outer membrane biosynthesis protein TonB